MGDFVAGDLIVTLSAADQEFIGLGKKITFPTLKFGDASLTYATGGLPLPAKEQFGMKKAILGIMVMNGNGWLYQYENSTHKLKCYTAPGVEYAGAPIETTLKLLVLGS